MNPEAAGLDAPHIHEYSMVENAGMRHAQELDYEKPATKSTAVAVESCKSIPGVGDNSSTGTVRQKLAAHSIAAVVIACFSILVALGAIGIALTNMATMKSQVAAQVVASMEAATDTNSTCLYNYV